MLGRFTFVLHTHLPYVLHHGKWPFGSDWLSEAVAECYIPLLQVLDRLAEQNVRARISMDFSPILLEQLADPDFPHIFETYCLERIDLAEKDIEMFGENGEKQYIPIAEFWLDFYQTALRILKNWYDGDLIAAFRRHSDAGTLDAMTCAATHGYLPLLLDDANVRAQLRIAIATHEKHFGKKPRGIWLPECAYRPRYNWTPPTGDEQIREHKGERAGIEEILAELGLEYFVVEGTLTKGGIPMGTYPELLNQLHSKFENDSDWHQFLFNTAEREDRSLAEMYAIRSTTKKIKGKLPVVFSRDRKTSEQVWSGEIGYPGEPNYLEFHKKHHNSGLRYWAVTDSSVDLADKKLYDVNATQEKIALHAQHFIGLVKSTLRKHIKQTGYDGIVCSPFDTELFGHWWFEGPQFIEKVITLLNESDDVRLTNCSEALDKRTRKYEVIALPEGSWGEGGGHYVWLNHNVTWMWDMIYSLEAQFLTNVRNYNSATKPSKFFTKAMTQAARELLLIESSDWQFLITTEGAADYAEKRFRKHCKRLGKLLGITERVASGKKSRVKDKEYIKKVEKDDHPFLEIDLNAWS